MRKLVHAITDNSLSIVLFTLFVICIVGDSFAGWRLQNETLAAHRHASISYRHFLSTGAFLDGLASNWQAAVLQLGSLVLFTSFLYQRGAPHSLDPRKAKHKQRWLKAGRFTWSYRHSLVLAFLLLFLVSLALHVVFGATAYNEERSFTGHPPFSAWAFMLSSKFWSTTLQTWQAEYLAIALYVVLTIFLRQQDSPESKPVESQNNTRPAEAPLSSPSARSLTMCPKRKVVVPESFCNGLRLHGIESEEMNNAANEGVISAAGSRVAVRVIRTDEESMIAKTLRSVLGLE